MLTRPQSKEQGLRIKKQSQPAQSQPTENVQAKPKLEKIEEEPIDTSILNNITAQSHQYQRKINIQHMDTSKEGDIFSIKYNRDATSLVMGLGDGNVQLYDLVNKKHTHRSLASPEFSAITSIRWRSDNKSFISVSADGYITHFHAPSGKMLHQQQEEDNSILCLDYNEETDQFVTAGKDKTIRIYDDDTKTVVHKFDPADWHQSGHGNRIFSVKYHPENPNVLLSGSWDSNLIIWDLKEKKHAGTMFGPSISGDAIDIQGNYVLTGSYRNEQQLQLWDIRQRALVQNIQWSDDKNTNQQVYLYCCQFSKKNKNLGIAGSTGIYQLKVFDLNDYKPVGLIDGFSKGVYAMDCSKDLTVFGGGNGVFVQVSIE